MKRKVSSIFFLVAFLSLLAHDMIPHHHHETEYSSSSIHQHEDEHCDSELAVRHDQSTCEAPGNILTDENHECPHHFHVCTIKNYYNLTHSGRLKNLLQKIKLSDLEINNSSNLDPGFLSGSNIKYPEPSVLLRKCFLKGGNSLRAPPPIG